MAMRASVLGSASNTARISSASRPSAVSKTRRSPAPRRLAKRIGRQAEQRHQGLDAGHGGHAEQWADRPAHSPLPTSTSRSQRSGNW